MADLGSLPPIVDAGVHPEYTHWNDEEVERLKYNCARDTVMLYNERDATCARCVAAARAAVVLLGQ